MATPPCAADLGADAGKFLFAVFVDTVDDGFCLAGEGGDDPVRAGRREVITVASPSFRLAADRDQDIALA